MKDSASISKQIFGQLDERKVLSFTLVSPSGLSCEVCSYGASLLRFWVPNSDGSRSNLLLAYKDLADYVSDPYFIGATVGRVANRIAGGRFEIGGRSFQLELNDPPHHLHGGSSGWHKQLWKAEVGELEGHPTLNFSLSSPDGDAGYPGALEARVSYQLLDSELRITMEAEAETETLVNMANHAYWNLAGSGSILDHKLSLNCAKFTPGDPVVPSGITETCAGSPLDFLIPRALGSRLPQNPGAPAGYDHNYLIDGMTRGTTNASKLGDVAEAPTLRKVALVVDPASGRRMMLSSNQPAVQLYTGNYLDGSRKGTSGALDQYGGFCLETQAVPNAINLPEFRHQVLLGAGKSYRHEMRFHFTWGSQGA